MYLLSLVFDIRLNTVTSMFSKASETHNLAHGLLTLLQLPLTLLTLIL